MIQGGILILFLSQLVFAAEPDWSKATPYPLEGRVNPYELSQAELQEHIHFGKIHALNYPVDVSGLQLPYYSMKSLIDADVKSPIRKAIAKVIQISTKVKSFDELMAWLGLHQYPEDEGDGVYFVPYPEGEKPDRRMGESLIQHSNVTTWTVSCAACHSSNLFGKKILGLQNRFPRANHFFVRGIKAMRVATPMFYKWLSSSTKEEKAQFKRTKKNIKFVEARNPVALGLDTSLSHVALSLSRRAKDAYASKDPYWSRHPRKEQLRNFVSDSKPGTWWNVKYKNRWLLDGSVVSGNPIYTNILWNELGRGTDLEELEQWFVENDDVIREMTAMVFASEAPHITDFFAAERIQLAAAKRGEEFYNNKCSKCHGVYFKNWSLPQSKWMSAAERLKTYRVEYHEQTPVKDVGTDPQRNEGTKSLLQLNDLAISQNNGIQIEYQKGYVPPPLVGIWARWPYFHNNSIPNLCELLKPAAQRVKGYWSGRALDKERDFDFNCNGYPLNERVPNKWKQKSEHFYDTTRPGQSNQGHDKHFDQLTDRDRHDLIQFLQTL